MLQFLLLKEDTKGKTSMVTKWEMEKNELCYEEKRLIVDKVSFAGENYNHFTLTTFIRQPLTKIVDFVASVLILPP